MVGNEFAFVPDASDVDGDTLNFSVSDLSAHTWLSFDTATGTLTGTPTENDVGTIEGIEIRVTDDSTDTLSASLSVFDLTVVAQPEASLLITEYVEGSSNNKAIEITNVSADTIDLSTVVFKNLQR